MFGKNICVKNKATVTTNNWVYNNGLPVATIFFIECDNNQLYCVITHGNASGTSLYSLLLYCGCCSLYYLTEQDRTRRRPMPFVKRTRCKALSILIINVYLPHNFLVKLTLNENDILSALRNQYTVSKVFISGSPSLSSAAFIFFPLGFFFFLIINVT